MKYGFKTRPYLEELKKLDYIDEDEAAPRVPAVCDCSFGVNPFGPSPKIDLAACAESVVMDAYPAFPYNELRDALCAYWKDAYPLSRENLRICSGSMLIVDSLCTLLVKEGSRVLGYSPQFPEFVNSVLIRGGSYDGIPLAEENGFRFDAGAFAKRLLEGDHAFAYIDNPNNPTGQVIPPSDIRTAADAAREKGILLVVDEAYGDFMTKAESAVTLIGEYDNIAVIRSFSKGFALAGLRVGYIAGAVNVIDFYRVIDDLLVSSVGCAAAVRALSDPEHLAWTVSSIRKAKKKLIEASPFPVMATDMRLPIFAMYSNEPGADLYGLLRDSGVISTTGFPGRGRELVRIRIPKDPETLMAVFDRLR